MLTKIRSHSSEVLLSNTLDFVTSLGFRNPINIKQSPGIEVWKARRYNNNYFIKIIEKYGPHSENMFIESRIHATFHTTISAETFDLWNLSGLATIELESFKPQSIMKLGTILDKYRNQPAENYSYVPKSRNLETLLVQAEKAVSKFRGMGLVDSIIENKLRRSIQLVALHYNKQTPVLCHGDVGNANFYQSQRHPLLLDWEDCFWGFPGFDEVYFLTFLSNRSMISESSLSQTGLEDYIAKATYSLIVILKEFIHLNAKQKVRQFSIVDRLNFMNF